MMSPGSLEQLQEYIDHSRHEYYLDGPNDVDWIFRNEVIQGREGTLYVDYVANEDQHSWADPAQFEELFLSSPEPWSVQTARYLHDVGCFYTRRDRSRRRRLARIRHQRQDALERDRTAESNHARGFTDSGTSHGATCGSVLLDHRAMAIPDV